MRLFIALPLAAAAVLSACGSGGVTAENESADSVAKKVAAAEIKPRAGKWESVVKFEKLDIDGMPQQAKDAMAKQMAADHKFTSCLTPEQVDKPDGGFFAGGGNECTYKRFTMAGGKIDAEMTCGKAPYQQAMTMNGSYSDTSYDVRVNSQSEVQPGKPMTVALAVASKRVGECDGKEDVTGKDVKDMEAAAKAMEAKAK